MQPGRLLRWKWITREELQRHPELIFVFGDNMLRKGFGGQAKEMRGEPNAVGVPVKWRPSRDAGIVNLTCYATNSSNFMD